MHITETRTEALLKALQEKHCMESCSTYGEQGYTQPEQGVLFANWNDVKQITQDYLVEAGYELEWNDEWVISYDHDKAYRTQPDSYSWVCAIAYTEYGDILTPDSDASEWIEEMSVTDPAQSINRALPDHVSDEDLYSEGYVLQSDDHDAEGWYGPASDPSDIVRELFDTVPDLESVVFRITSSGQFSTGFDVWTKVA